MELPLSARRSDAWMAAALTGLALILLAPGLGSLRGLRHPDEAYYLSVILQMERSGDWLIPRIDGMPSFFKPPLYYWCALLCRAVLTETLWAARLPSALFAAGSVGLTYLLAREWYPRRPAVLAALFLVSMVGVQRFGRSAMLESGLLFGATLAAFGAVRSARHSGWLLLTGLGAALSALLKWHGVALVPLSVALGALWATRNLRALWSLGAALGALAALLLPLPWFYVAAQVPGFVEGFWAENVSRLGAAREAPISLLGVPLYGLPWTPLALVALSTLRRTGPREPALTLPLLWAAVVLLFWLLPASAQYTHHAQAGLPAVALLAVRALCAAEPRTRLSAKLLSLPWLLVAPALLVVARVADAPTAFALAALALLVTAGAVLLFTLRLHGAAACAAVSLALALGVVIPRLDTDFLPSDTAEALVEVPHLAAYGTYPGYYETALRRPVARAWTEADLARRLARGEAVILDPTDPSPAEASTLLSWPRTKTRLGWAQLTSAFESASLTPARTTLRLVSRGEVASQR